MSCARSAAGALLVLIVASVAYALTNAIINPLLLEVARGFRVPLGLAGQARTVLSAAGAATALAATFLADRVPRRWQLLAGLGALVAAHTGLALVRLFGWWMALQALAGMGTAIVSLAGTAAVADYFPEPQRGAAMGWITTGYPLAWLLGLPLAGWVADGWGWRVSYLVAGTGVSALAFLGVLLGLPAPAGAASVSSPYRRGWRMLAARAGVRGWILGELLATTAWSGFLVFVGSFFGVTYGLRSGAIGMVMAVFATASVAGTSSSGWWGDRWGRGPVLLASTFLAALWVAPSLSLRLTPAASLALVLPYGFVSSVRFPTSGVIALQLAPDARGTIMAARALTITLGGMLGTVLGGVLLTVSGFAAVGVAYAGLTAAGLVAYRLFIPRALLERDTWAAPEAPAGGEG